MYRRVIVPMGVAVGVTAGLLALSGLTSLVDRQAVQALTRDAPAWMLPALPSTSWAVFLAVFFSVRLCALRGGSRRECLAVGLSLVVLSLLWGLVLLWGTGFLSLLTVFGDTTPVQNHVVTLGSALAARTYAARLLGLAGTCLGATWLYFFMTRRRLEHLDQVSAG